MHNIGHLVWIVLLITNDRDGIEINVVVWRGGAGVRSGGAECIWVRSVYVAKTTCT